MPASEATVERNGSPLGEPDPEAGSALRVANLTKDFARGSGDRVIGLDDVSLEVEAGEFLVILGPSGCGKTTLLRCIAGLETPDSGVIEMNGERVFGGPRLVRTEHRGLSMMFQSYALWPHMTVFGNVAYPLRTRRVGRQETRRRVEEILEVVGIGHLGDRHPNQLSGGQQQRVALARALVCNSGLVLFDEPLSNVDAKVREELRSELLVMQRELGFMAVYVTHDQEEALALADRVALFDHGRIAQLSTPAELYDRPASAFAASFVGSSNELGGAFLRTVDGLHGPQAVIATEVGEVVTACLDPESWVEGTEVRAFVRPHLVQLAGSPVEPGPNRWRAKVLRRSFCGSYSEYVLEAEGATFRAWAPVAVAIDEGAEVAMAIDADAVRAYPAGA